MPIDAGVALRNVLDPAASVRQLRDGLYSSLPAGDAPAQYDRMAGVYDAIVGREWYQRIFWGTSRASFTRLAERAREHAGHQWLVENACGSLLFTARVHGAATAGRTLLVDRSIGMLERAARRLRGGGAGTRAPVLMHGDAGALPVRDAVITSVLCLNVLHVPCDAAGIVKEAARVLLPGKGRLFASTLVRAGRWSDAYGEGLARRGILAPLRTVDALHTMIHSAGFTIEESRVEGNMCCLVARAKP